MSGQQSRHSGIEGTGPLQWGSHFCLFYATPDQYFNSIMPFLRAGLESDENCLLIIPESFTVHSVSEKITDALPHLDRATSHQRFEISDLFHTPVATTPETFSRLIAKWYETAIASGRKGLRCVIGMSGSEHHSWDFFAPYEEAIDTFLSGRNILALCTFSALEYSLSETAGAASCHDFSLIASSEGLQVVGSNHHMRVERTLRESEARLRRAQEVAHLGSWELDHITGILSWSDEVFRIFGLSRSDCRPSYELLLDVTHPEDRQAVDNAYTGSINRGRSSFELIHRIIKKNTGDIRFIHEKCDHTFNQSGTVVRSVGLIHDVTERKRTEEEFARKHYETVLANRILHLFMEEAGDDLFNKVLQTILDGTDSRHGILGYISEPGRLVCPSLSAMMDTCTVEGRAQEFPRDKWKGAWGRALEGKKSVIVNIPVTTPKGHVSISNCLATPIIFQNRVIGLLNQANKDGGYTEDDRELAEEITRRMAPVLYAWIERKLREDERESAHQRQTKILKRFELLAQTAGELLHSTEPNRIVNTLSTSVMHFLDCQVFFNYLTDETGRRLHLNACEGIFPHEARQIEWIGYGTTICGCVARDGRRIVTERIGETIDDLAAQVQQYGIRAFACHPLPGPDGKAIGTLSFGTRTRDTFAPDELELMKAVADLVATALIRVRSEAILRASQEELKRAQTMGKIGSWSMDYSTQLLTWSDEHFRIFCIPENRIITWTDFLSYVHPEDRDKMDESHLNSYPGRYCTLELRILNGNLVKWVRITVETERDTSGSVIGRFGTTQDITEQKQYEIELRAYRENLEKIVDERTMELRRSQELLLHAQKMEAMGQMAGGVAHDFNNMMQVVIGYTHRTLRKLDFDNPLRENLEHVEQAAKSAATLTHRLLAFSRKQMLQPQIFTPANLISKLKPILRHTLGEDITTISKISHACGLVKADPTQLEQVIMNMAVNARNAMPEGGTLTFEITNVHLSDKHPFDKDPVPPGEYIMIAISDTGCGMEPKVLEKIFDPFFTTRPFGTGSGLGLATAYGTVRQSGGVIRVYSTPGKGTTFKIFLPRCFEDLREEMHSLPATHLPHIGGGTILIVEDNTMAREFISLELGDLGYNPLTAANGSEALNVAQSWKGPIHLLLTDVVLPGMSGMSIARKLSAKRPEMKILFMSGYDKDNIIRQGKFVPDARLLAKPFSPDQLASAIREALTTRDPDRLPSGALPADSPSKEKAPHPVQILVVDDDPGIGEIISEVLSTPDNEVHVAVNGTTALEIVKKKKPSVVLLDIKLPDMNGYELSRRIRTYYPAEPPYIIAASGYAPDSETASSLFDEYMIKPLDFGQLRDLIDIKS